MAKQPSADAVVAEIGGQLIHQSEVMDEIRTLPGGGGPGAFTTLYQVALRRVIERAALVARGRAEGLAEQADVLRHMQEASDRVLEEAYLQHATAERVTEDMLLARYRSEIAGKPGPQEVHGWAILVPREAEALEIIAKLKAGADFAALAREFSKDVSAKDGGDLGFVQRDALAPEVGAVLLSLQPGTVASYPVKTLAGWFVLKVTARRAAPTPSFAEARNRLEAECQRDEIAVVVGEALGGNPAPLPEAPPNEPTGTGGVGTGGAPPPAR